MALHSQREGHHASKRNVRMVQSGTRSEQIRTLMYIHGRPRSTLHHACSVLICRGALKVEGAESHREWAPEKG